MAKNTYTAINKTVLSVNTPSVTFNVSSLTGYTHLELKVNSKTTVQSGVRIAFNNETTGSNYSHSYLYGTGSVATSAKESNQSSGRLSYQCYSTTTSFSQYKVEINNYNGSMLKTALVTGGNADIGVEKIINLWRSTSAITHITVFPNDGSFAPGTSVSLYGTASWSEELSTKATGGYVTYDDSYWYHTFLYSSTFTPNTALTADILQIAGGGGGGNSGDRGSGGGGAGGLLAFSAQSLTTIPYTVTVGGGGAKLGSGYTSNGFAGSNSQFASLSASIGGGGGGCESTYQAGDIGGSGGGGGASSASAAGSVNGTSGQGNPGGSGYYNPSVPSDSQGGGGGGAGGAGNNGSSKVPGAGGIGVTTYSSWGLATKTGEVINGSIYYAGGGGGAGGGLSTLEGRFALGGFGGGGQGSSLINGFAKNGMATTGGGGGAQSWNGYSGNGGSGVVIVRYPR